MDSRVKSKSESSLCEKSMKVVVTVIRLSSFSIAQRTLGGATTGKAGKAKDLSSGADYSDMEPEKAPRVPDQFPAASKRSQQPQSRANPTYFKSIGGNACNGFLKQERVHEKEQCVDGLASDYISKIRDKLGRGL